MHNYPLIAREAWLIIAILTAISGLIHYTLGLTIALPLWLLTLAVSFLFRDPRRPVPPKPLAVVSPVDGVVLQVQPVDNPYLDGAAVKIQLRMAFIDVYTIRSLIEGKILKQWLSKKQVAAEPIPERAAETQTQVQLPEDRFGQWVQSDELDDVIMAVKPVTLKRLHCYVHSGERIGQGQRCGIAPFGATVDVYVPESSRIDVKSGDKVRAGSDTLATLVH